MDDLHDRLFQLAQEGSGDWRDLPAQWRKRWLRRMLVLLGMSCLAFSITAFWLSHIAAESSVQSADSQAVEVVQAHLAALHRGDFRAAYALFSPRLQRRMPFGEFRSIMEAHLPLLRGKTSVFPETTAAGRVVVDINFHGTARMDLTAEFILVRSDGRWCIDQIHWNLERLHPRHLLRA